jgi:ferric-dicitrate binding protein FerR (iron transport regulator)/TolA-binding protein
MKKSTEECGAVERLWHEQAGGRSLTADETARVEAHLARCVECRLVEQTFEAARFDGAGGPAPELDDLARRRMLDGLVRDALTPRERASRTAGGSSRRAVIWAVAATLAVLLGGAVVWAIARGWGVDEAAPLPVETAEIVQQGELLLAAGEVRVSGQERTVGADLVLGQILVVGQGRAAFELGTGVAALVEAGSSIELVDLGPEEIELRLEAGRVLVQVDPDRAGPPVVVSAGTGRVVVTGTAFAVGALDDRAEVQVYRGRVRVEGLARKPRQVSVGRGAELGSDTTFELTSDEMAMAMADLSALELLVRSDAAVVDVDSEPTGASVSLDGARIGATPLQVSVRPGQRSLGLFLEGHLQVKDSIVLEAGRRWSMDFELQSEEPQAAAEPERSVTDDRAAQGSKVGAAGTGSKQQPEQPRPGPEELLEQAQAHRAAKQWAAAARAYQELIARYPGRAEARSSLVSLGNIQLDHLRRPAAALRSFDSYLVVKRTGPLAQEAAFGRAVAFRALGNRDSEVRALQSFLQRFPTAIQAPQARARLAALQK